MRLGITQKELAEKMGVTPAAVSLWEKDSRDPRLPDLVLLASVLKASLNELVLGQKK
jgi:transcriptional regulator with XRE-family HTH domain